MSDLKKERTPEERWRAVTEGALGPEARLLEAATDEAIDQELRASGVNPERLARDGNALAARLLREAGVLPGEGDDARDGERARAPEPEPSDDRVLRSAPPAPILAQAEVIPLATRRRPRWPLLMVAAVLAALAIPAGLTVALRGPTEVPTPVGPAPLEVAAQLRYEAEIACNTAEWQECLDKLDQARTLDVGGDNTTKVEGLRAAARKALTPPPPVPVPREDDDKKAPKGDKAPGRPR